MFEAYAHSTDSRGSKHSNKPLLACKPRQENRKLPQLETFFSGKYLIVVGILVKEGILGVDTNNT